MTGSRGSQKRSAFGRFLAAITPTAGEGVPEVVTVARARLSAWTYGAIGLAVGCATGLLLVLIVFAIPRIPTMLAGFAGGALIGSAFAVILASRYPLVRKGGGIAILLLPLLLLAAPFLLVALAVTVLVKTKPRAKATDATVEILPRRRRKPSA